MKKIDKSVLLEVKAWSHGQASYIAREAGCHVNTVTAQLAGRRFSQKFWEVIIRLLKEDKCDKRLIARVAVYYCQSLGQPVRMYKDTMQEETIEKA